MSASPFSSGYSIPNTVADGLFVSIGGGSNTVTGLTVAQAAQTLTMTARTTNYGYIDPVTGLVAVNTTGFVSGQIPLFIAVADTFQVTTINDVRVTYAFSAQAGGGPFVQLNPTANQTITLNATTLTAATNIYSGPSQIILNGPNDLLEIHTEHTFGISIFSHAARTAELQLFSSGGTALLPTATTLNIDIGLIQFFGYNSASYQNSATMTVTATENWTTSARGAKLVFQTVTTGTNGLTPILTLQDGTVRMTNALFTTIAPVVAAAQVGLGSTTAATATAGGGQAALATVLGYLVANVAGTTVKIPYFSN